MFVANGFDATSITDAALEIAGALAEKATGVFGFITSLAIDVFKETDTYKKLRLELIDIVNNWLFIPSTK